MEEREAAGGLWIGFMISVMAGIVLRQYFPENFPFVALFTIATLITALGTAIGYVAQARSEHDETLEKFRAHERFYNRFVPLKLRQTRIDDVLCDLAIKHEAKEKDLEEFLRGGLEKFPGPKDESREDMKHRYNRQMVALEEAAKEARQQFNQAYHLIEELDSEDLTLEDCDPAEYIQKQKEKTPAA